MSRVSTWPVTPEGLIAAQRALATVARPPPWRPATGVIVAGCFACLPRRESGAGTAGDPVWAAAAAYRGELCVGRSTVSGAAGGPYVPGLLALRIGAPLEAAVRALPVPPDVLLVDATGHDHPRRAGLAVHLGFVLDLPTVGVTHRTLLATGEWPPDEQGAASPLLLDGDVVGHWLRTRAGRRPVAIHAGWRIEADTAVGVALAVARHRTPTPLREARRLARAARASDAG
jgi:deoxyribonuclease V